MAAAVAVLASSGVRSVGAQSDMTDATLTRASDARTVRLGSASGAARPVVVPLEVYVARVLAGEAEPRAPEAAQQAVAIAIRTFALVNVGRHGREGFDLCDSTHCQVPRAATSVTRRAALATVGQILTRNGRPAEVFYSASCGGYSESAGEVWPGADLSYMPAAPDDVHEADPMWALALSLREIERALLSAGFVGELTGVAVDSRNASGRVTRVRLVGLRPDVVAGVRFRAILGAARVRSTAFSVESTGGSVRFVGRGYGHGVGMCVVGAGRRATRGETTSAILMKYFPGLAVARLSTAGTALSRPVDAAAGVGPVETTRVSRGGIEVEVGRGSGIGSTELRALAARTHDELSQQLGASVAPIRIRLHESLETFRGATGRPWWVSAASDRGVIDLVPAAVLAQREGVEVTLRIAVADTLLSSALRGRPAWVRVGAARYFGHRRGGPTPDAGQPVRCPSDAELDLAISAAAQRDADARAESCFAREYGRTGDWRTVQ